MSLTSASSPAILRAAQKDEYFTNKLTGNASEVLRLLGNRTWSKFSHHIPAASEIAYGSLTTLKDLQTLGEEYTGIVQVDDSYMKIPNKLCQLIAILLGACGETVVKNALNRLKNNISKSEELLPDAKRFFLKLILVTQWSLPVLKDLHQAWFYLGGRHYNLRTRFMGINYVSAVPIANPHSDMLRPLGIPSLLRAVISALKSPPSFEDLNIKENSTSTSNSAVSCSGCLEDNLTPCALPCGHVLCNNCARGSSVCAFCRAPYLPNRTVPLQNLKLCT